MSKLLNAFEEETAKLENLTTSDKGDIAYKSTLSSCVDLYAAQGALRGEQHEYMGLFTAALLEDKYTATALWFLLRDIRGGMGERDLFRGSTISAEAIWGEDFRKLIPLIAKYGRVDDLFHLNDKGNVRTAAKWLKDVLVAEDGTPLAFYKGLVAKWLPRKPKTVTERYIMDIIAKELRINRHTLRKLIAQLSSTVEQAMSQNNWGFINFNTVPSKAMKQYQKAYLRRLPEQYKAWLASLAKPESGAKVNASTLYPYEILNKGTYGMADEEWILRSAQWAALPDYFNGVKRRILPMIDVSGSMETPIPGTSTTCMDAAISLGVYIAERQDTIFKDHYLTFSEDPRLAKIKRVEGPYALYELYQDVKGANWGYNTNIRKAFNILLETAQLHNLTDDDMPEMLVILSDMNFDMGAEGYNKPLYEELKVKFANAGLTLPKVIYWDLNHNGAFTCKVNDVDVCEISGFSPSVMKSVLENIDSITPENIMLQAVKPYIDEIKKLVDTQ